MWIGKIDLWQNSHSQPPSQSVWDFFLHLFEVKSLKLPQVEQRDIYNCSFKSTWYRNMHGEHSSIWTHISQELMIQRVLPVGWILWRLENIPHVLLIQRSVSAAGLFTAVLCWHREAEHPQTPRAFSTSKQSGESTTCQSFHPDTLLLAWHSYSSGHLSPAAQGVTTKQEIGIKTALNP